MTFRKKRHLSETNIILEERYLNEACSLKPFPKRELIDYNTEMRYISAAKKIVETLVNSGEFALIKENDGCGNYVKEEIDKYYGSYYYAPLSIKSDPVMVVNIDGAYNLNKFISTGNVTCIVSVKCGCGKSKSTEVNPNDDYSSIITSLNSTGLVELN